MAEYPELGFFLLQPTLLSIGIAICCTPLSSQLCGRTASFLNLLVGSVGYQEGLTLIHYLSIA